MSVHFQSSKAHGVRIASAETSFLQSVSLSLLLPVGSRHETDQPTGISHFAEHMIFKGTATRSAEDIAKQVEGSGASMNAYTTEDHTMLEMRGPAGSEDLMLEIMADMVWQSTHEQEEIENECDVIEEEIIGYEESPAEHVHDLLSKALWGDHPLGQSITGSIESIQQIDSNKLKDFTAQCYYQKDAITLAGGGNISHQKLEQLALDHLPNIDKPTIQTSPIEQFTAGTETEYRDIEQAHLCLGFQAMGRHSEDRHTLRLISLMLGETMSSRLFQKIREELGLCYSIHTDFTLFEDIGSFNITAALDGKRFDFAQEAIQQVLSTFLKEGVTESELQRAKTYALSQTQIALEGSQSFMQWASDSMFCYNRIILPEEAQSNTTRVTLDDIHRVANTVITLDNFATAVIAPE